MPDGQQQRRPRHRLEHLQDTATGMAPVPRRNGDHDTTAVTAVAPKEKEQEARPYRPARRTTDRLITVGFIGIAILGGSATAHQWIDGTPWVAGITGLGTLVVLVAALMMARLSMKSWTRAQEIKRNSRPPARR